VIAVIARISGVTPAEWAAGFARRADGVTEMVRSAHIVTAALPKPVWIDDEGSRHEPDTR
jgi:hypothetical protein